MATYLRQLRCDLLELLDEIDRLKAKPGVAAANPFDWDAAESS